MSLPKHLTECITALYSSYKNAQETSKENKTESLKLIIEEQRRDYNYLLHIYNRIRAIESILLTASFGTIAYLYSSAAATTSKQMIAQRLFIPIEDYGKAIYVIAAAFFLYGVLKITLTVFGNNPWETTYESAKDNYSYDQIDTLQYVKKRYDECHDSNCEVYFKRRNQLTFLFYCILVSAIILIVIKTLK